MNWIQETIVIYPDGKEEIKEPIERTADRMMELFLQCHFLKQDCGEDIAFIAKRDKNYELEVIQMRRKLRDRLIIHTYRRKEN